MNILALDQASKVTGYSIWKDNELISYGKIDLSDPDLGERLCKLRTAVIELINNNKIDLVAFEDIQLQGNVVNNVQTFKVLAEVFGVIDELVTELHLEKRVILAGTWKSKLGIKGKQRAEQKRNAQKYVLDTYGVQAIQDICDAICIGACQTLESESEAGFDWSI